MKKFTILLLLLCTFVMAKSQELSLGVDLFNRYIWRGLDLGGKSPSIQPYASVKFGGETHALTIGTWGAFSVAGTANEETDLYVNYSYKGMVNLMVTDYFFPGLNQGARDKYFEWDSDSTGHVLEAAAAFSGTENFPFTALFAMNFYGNDARKINGNLFMSKYVEIGYKRTIKNTDLNVFAGAALDNPDTDAGETGYYLNENAGIINLGVKLAKTVAISDKFSIPMQCSFSVNPDLGKVYIALGVSF
jgi:hypothetical protein